MKKNTIITTVSGNNVERRLCKRIGDEYYQMNVDCFEIDGKWYRKNNLRIYFNEIENKYMKITKNTITGIVGIKSTSNSFDYVMSRFEKSYENELKIITRGGVYYVANNKIFNQIPKVFNSEDGNYYDYYMAAANNVCNPRMNGAYVYSFPRLYNCEKLLNEFQSVDNSKYVDDILGTINGKSKRPKILENYSFGIEFETGNGIIAEHKCKELGLIPLRDGSIGGHEYTTIPMHGNEGINLIMNQTAELRKRTVFNRDCSLHIHFGGYPVNPDSILNLYNLCFKLQNQIGAMFPGFVFSTSKYKRGGKDYCMRLPSFVTDFKAYYQYMADNKAVFNGSLTEPHPEDPNRDRKWENHKRYFYVNFINMLFGENPKTVEFRIHTPTFNYSKIINWMFICMAILEYAKTHTIKVNENINLEHVVYSVYSGAEAAVLIDYIDQRTKYFFECGCKFGDKTGVIDIIEDEKQNYKTIYEV